MSVNPNPSTTPLDGNHLYSSMPIQGQIGDVHVSTAGGGGGGDAGDGRRSGDPAVR